MEPKASATLCDMNPVEDATVCYALETKLQGSISVYAWYQRKTCRVRKWKLKCYVSKIHSRNYFYSFLSVIVEGQEKGFIPLFYLGSLQNHILNKKM